MVDTDGDGLNETILEPNVHSPQQIIQELTTYIQSLSMNAIAKKVLLVRTKVIGELIKWKKFKAAKQQINSLERTVKLYTLFNLISHEEKDVILGHLDSLALALTN